MIKIKVKDFNLKDTITCGQIFRFIEEQDSYIVVLNDRVVRLKQDGNILVVSSNNEKNLEQVIVNYLDLDRDYEKINSILIKNNEDLKEAIIKSKGLKMIKQAPFETIISYIISANNRVSMISRVVNNISEKYGQKVVFENKEYYLFPTPSQMNDCTKEQLRALKTGFRDEYIYEIVNRINDNLFNINSINDMNTMEAMDYLMNNKGIGEKVSSCILLFGYSKFDVFPIDTWVKKYMKDNYNIEGIKNIKDFSINNYKEYSGLAIQYMFNSRRNKV